MILGALVQKLISKDYASGHLGFHPLAKNAGIFGRDVRAYFFIKDLSWSNQSSKHVSQRMVTELGYLTRLVGVKF